MKTALPGSAGAIWLWFMAGWLAGCGPDQTAEVAQSSSSSSSVISSSSTSSSLSSSGISSVSSVSSSVVTSNSSAASSAPSALQFVLPDTGQRRCFDENGVEVGCEGSGQDGDYTGNAPTYTAVDDAVVLDDVTGLMWQRDADANGDLVIDIGDKMGPDEAEAYCGSLTLGGFEDWRLPDIKTLYSLVDFSGKDVSGATASAYEPFIDTDLFAFAYGDTDAGERIIDSQWATTTYYVSTVMNGQTAMFGFNFADGRIKGYPVSSTFYVRCVRGNTDYGINLFTANGDGTVSDRATGLMWEQNDSAVSMTWSDAIDYCEQSGSAGYTDWRLPNAKALQSLVDYTRAPDTSDSAAIDTAYFNTTKISNEAGQEDYGFFWSSTTHISDDDSGHNAVYISFGRAMGYMDDAWLDVHGAGAQRSDPKRSEGLDVSYETVDAYGGTALSHGPQGDVVRIENFVRCVRDMP